MAIGCALVLLDSAASDATYALTRVGVVRANTADFVPTPGTGLSSASAPWDSAGRRAVAG